MKKLNVIGRLRNAGLHYTMLRILLLILPPGYCQDEWVDRIEMSEGSNNDRQVLGVLQRKYNMPEDQLVQLAEKNASSRSLGPAPVSRLLRRAVVAE